MVFPILLEEGCLPAKGKTGNKGGGSPYFVFPSSHSSPGLPHLEFLLISLKSFIGSAPEDT
jgi:hypothetical protein